jgi:NAD(P)-dependent dehydrogenase (short-subunit alcohol dehydrogenase family)
MRRFEGKRVLVTGGAAGIGAAIVGAFVAEGGAVAVFDRSAPKEPIPGVVYLEVDVADEAAVRAGVSRAAQALGGDISVLVNNAAIFVYGAVDEASSADWDRALGVNVKGYAHTMSAVLPGMKAAGGGAVVNISSVSAFIAQERFVPYSVTKAAVLQMTRNVAMDVGAFNIRVNAVCPGPILTDATAKHAAGQGKTVEAVVAELTGHLVIKRMGSGSEVAKAVLFLASEDASFTTGSSLMVDGGFLLC